jgi:hypothetical protein
MKQAMIMILATAWAALIAFACTFNQAIKIVADEQDDEDTA